MHLTKKENKKQDIRKEINVNTKEVFTFIFIIDI